MLSKKYDVFFPSKKLMYSLTLKKVILSLILLGSYGMYWSYKCFDPYFLDQPVRIFEFFPKYIKGQLFSKGLIEIFI